MLEVIDGVEERWAAIQRVQSPDGARLHSIWKQQALSLGEEECTSRLTGQLGTSGIVTALAASFVVDPLLNPPSFSSASIDISYGVLMGLGFLLNMACVMTSSLLTIQLNLRSGCNMTIHFLIKYDFLIRNNNNCMMAGIFFTMCGGGLILLQNYAFAVFVVICVIFILLLLFLLACFAQMNSTLYTESRVEWGRLLRQLCDKNDGHNRTGSRVSPLLMTPS
mmetsp:Transcript_24707/g.80812  ORF Transcript_24707/g.80812 Transcript_24707/m.80812 type:complete len:222 (+) Transcript_24707:302-967(+)